MQNLKNAEILSPVGNKEMLIAAVRSGADAVYLGAEEFSARRNAENFSLNDLNEAIKYCHIRGVKVYLTLNILIKENELGSAFSLAKKAYNMGIDGIIIQDLGLARVLHEKIPNLKLHASTQMSVLSPAALPILKNLGFTQVVVGREMSKTELKNFCAKAKELNITVEAFVHGALCMSVSGQCLLSAFLGSRSGNRGLCAGPCRLPFSVKNGTGYDLSLKDLSLLENIKELYEIGVRSFKIEGRMKRPEYVAAATAACREALDNGIINLELQNTLKNVFSRSGFTDGYFESTLGREMFGIRTKEDVVAADKAFPTLHKMYRFERKNVAIDIIAKISPQEPIYVSFSDGENTATITGNIPQNAQNRSITKEDVLKNLSKLGDTPYYVKNADLTVSDGLFVSAGEINDLRRNLCELLNDKRSKTKTKESDATYFLEKEFNNHKKTPKIVIRVEKTSQIPQNTQDIAAIILPLEENSDIIRNYSVPIIADIPRGVSNEEKLLNQLISFKENGGKAAFCSNLSHIEPVQKSGLVPLADIGLNITNSESIATFKKLGINTAIISPEEKITDIATLSSDINKGILAYGNIPLMLFRNCPLKNGISCKDCKKDGVITDRLGIDFPIRCRGGYSELLNSLPLWLADKAKELYVLDFIVLYFTRETPERVKDVIAAYKNSLPPDTDHTRGLYYRGTL
ncbi:MAG: U32 family peptidase [Ruminococcaceae bacterium]|nr:U32 family peptidase [Oscillospiraceae bacterium]